MQMVTSSTTTIDSKVMEGGAALGHCWEAFVMGLIGLEQWEA
jgi:hypothetical protein